MPFEEVLKTFGTERRMNYTLGRLAEALLAVGSPQLSLKAFLVGGTNGKGSVALLISQGLSEAGHLVATYLSPHLQHPHERFLDNLIPAQEAELAGLAGELLVTGKRFDLSYFEFLTLLFFVWAKRRAFEFCVLEVGLGGRLDATNLVNPLASIITTISLDHQEYLGHELSAILKEKLGIVRKESLLFTGISQTELKQQVIAESDALDTIYYFSSEMKTELKHRDWKGQAFTINGYPFSMSNPTDGAIENTALAYLFFRIVFPVIPLATLQRAFAKSRNPGRFEVMQEKPRVILSGDHNAAGIEDLATTLSTLSKVRLKIICGFSGDKPYRQLVERLGQLSSNVQVVPVKNARMEADEGYRSLTGYQENAVEAVKAAIAAAAPTDTILVTGSLYLVGEIRSLWPNAELFN